MKVKRLLKPAALTAGLLAAASIPCQGTMTLTLDPGAGPAITIVDGGPGDMHPNPGAVNWVGSIPGSPWFLTVAVGLGKPVIGGPLDPRLDLLVNANSTGPGTLSIHLSDDGFGPFVSGAGTVKLLAGGVGGSVTASALVNDIAVTTLGPFSARAWDGTATGTVNGLAGSFSIGESVIIQHAASGHSGGDFELGITPVPEPSTMLAGISLLLPFALAVMRHSQTKHS